MNDLDHPPLFATGQRVRIVASCAPAYHVSVRGRVGAIYSVRENRTTKIRRYLVDYAPSYGRDFVRESHLEVVEAVEAADAEAADAEVTP